MSHSKLVLLKSYSQSIDAQMAKSFLATQGIECTIKDEHIVSMNWLYSNAVGGVKLLVAEDLLENAQQLLDSVESKEFALNENLVQGIPCEKCQSLHTEIIDEPSRKYSLLLAIGVGAFLPLPFLNYEEWKCHKCGHTWKQFKSVNIVYLLVKWLLLITAIFGIYYSIKSYTSE